jgi:hypothetical protein
LYSFQMNFLCRNCDTPGVDRIPAELFPTLPA